MASIVCSGPFRPGVLSPTTRKAPKVSPVLKTAEILNGRLAMQGCVWGTVNQVVMNEGGVQQQIQDPHNLMTAAAVTTLVALGTSVTQNDSEHKSYFAWTPDAELLNGRAAMCAIAAALAFNL